MTRSPRAKRGLFAKNAQVDFLRNSLDAVSNHLDMRTDCHVVNFGNGQEVDHHDIIWGRNIKCKEVAQTCEWSMQVNKEVAMRYRPLAETALKRREITQKNNIVVDSPVTLSDSESEWWGKLDEDSDSKLPL